MNLLIMVKRILAFTICVLWGGASNAQPDTMFFNLLLTTEPRLILDVQPNSMYKIQHINGAVNAPTKAFLVAICDTVDRQLPIFVYCWSGDRSKSAVDILKKMGFVYIFEMIGGLEAFYKRDVFQKYSSYLIIDQ